MVPDNYTSIDPKRLSRQELLLLLLLLLWRAAAAPAPSSESNVNSTTAEEQQNGLGGHDEDNRGQKDEGRKTTRTRQADKRRASCGRTTPKGYTQGEREERTTERQDDDGSGRSTKAGAAANESTPIQQEGNRRTGRGSLARPDTVARFSYKRTLQE